MSRKIHQNIWGNWNGYIGRRRVVEFGTAEDEAKRWVCGLECEPKVDMSNGIIYSREWAMPSSDTFSVRPIGDMVKRYLSASKVSCDPFARNNRWATHTNDINPNTNAEHHMDCVDFLNMLFDRGIRCDLALLDPPYSPRQISECYQEAGIKCGMKETQNAALYARVKDALSRVMIEGGIVLSFGWNSAGMGKKHNYNIIEVMLVCHGSAHNDTICLAERNAGIACLSDEP